MLFCKYWTITSLLGAYPPWPEFAIITGKLRIFKSLLTSCIKWVRLLSYSFLWLSSPASLQPWNQENPEISKSVVPMSGNSVPKFCVTFWIVWIIWLYNSPVSPPADGGRQLTARFVPPIAVLIINTGSS